jgi:O-antigen biosynthesis protein WbqP
MKRLFDIIAAAAGLALTWPIILFLAIVIRFQTKASGIFTQERVGRHERVFRCHKLRTMRPDTPDLPTHEATRSSVTPLGRFLRASKLDELPQMWNVIIGDMSFVGPRPCLPSQTILCDERRVRGVFDVSPGITGLAQIEGIDMSDPVRLAEKDAEYTRSQSMMADFIILFRTVFAGAGRGDRVKS